jgi:hypothetical protein
MARIKLVGFGDAKTIEDIFASSMVDVAYIDEVTPDAIYVIGDIGINFERPEDFVWVKEVIEATLAQYNVRNLEITLTE